jgi:hypothetical protein
LHSRHTTAICTPQSDSPARWRIANQLLAWPGIATALLPHQHPASSPQRSAGPCCSIIPWQSVQHSTKGDLVDATARLVPFHAFRQGRWTWQLQVLKQGLATLTSCVYMKIRHLTLKPPQVVADGENTLCGAGIKKTPEGAKW